MNEDDILKDEGDEELINDEPAPKKKADLPADPLDDAESIDELEEEEEEEEEPFDDVNPI